MEMMHRKVKVFYEGDDILQIIDTDIVGEDVMAVSDWLACLK